MSTWPGEDYKLGSMNPILSYLKNLLAKQHVLGGNEHLTGVVAADLIFEKLIRERRIPGLAITVQKEGQVFFQRGYGYSDLDRKKLVDPRKSIFRIASVSKPISATALALMVDEGIMDLDSSFYKYVPYFPKKKWDFTIRQLAGHTAGIRGYRGIEYARNKPYSIEESIEVFKDDDLLFEPGTDYFYNSYDWVLISLAMQKASGVPFEKYVHDKVLRPLQMARTFHSGSPLTNTPETSKLNSENITSFYSKSKFGIRNAIPVNNFYKLAGGGFLSTSPDIVKLGQAYLDGKILNDSLRAEFLTPQIVNGSPTYYGLGWQVSKDKNGRPFYGHIGNGVGGYSNFFVYPNEQMVIAILVNCTDPKVQEEFDMAIDLLLNTRKEIS